MGEVQRRVLLYGAAVVVIAVVVVLVARRREVDRQDEIAVLDARITGFDMILNSDPSGAALLKILEDDFSAPDLPPGLRQKVLRARAMVGLLRRDETATFSALDEAATLEVDDTLRVALDIDRARALADFGHGLKALETLDALGTPKHPTLAIWKALVAAQILVDVGRRDEGLKDLDEALEGLERPLPETAPILVGLTPWTAWTAARMTTQSLCDLWPEKPAPARHWLRLLELAPGDLAAALEAAGTLLRAGHAEAAATAWRRALAIDADLAREKAAQDPDLGRLASDSDAKLLKPEAGGGR